MLLVFLAVEFGTTRPTSSAQKGTVAISPPLCGHLDDKKAHLPPDWTTFTPPNVGESYVDPVFGCRIKRLTESSVGDTLWDGTHSALNTYYSTFTPINASDSMLMIGSNDGTWRIIDTDGKVVVPVAKMPKMNDGHPVWDAANGDEFYYAYQDALYRGTVEGHSIGQLRLQTFAEYTGIVSPDSADLSQDGDHIALVGENRNRTMDVFVWSLGKRMKTITYTTNCTIGQWGVTQTPQPGCIHKLQLTANNLLAIQFESDGHGPEQGLRLWQGNQLVHLQDGTNHTDTGYDLSGKPIFIEMGRSSTLSGDRNPCPTGWGLDVRQLENLSSAICLLDNEPELHVSYRGGISQPWVALSFFDDRKYGPEFFTKSVGYQAPTAANWKLYEDELIVARVDAAAVYRLAQMRSRSAENYWAQAHAAISRDGKYIIFNSNMAHPDGCPAKMHVADECTDVYMIKIG